MGESRFAEWCESFGFCANGSLENDTKGWDFFVEEDFTDREEIPYDLAAEPLKFLVQIKSTDKHNLSWSVSLSTLRSLISGSTLPAFFILLNYQETANPEKIYVKHLDADLITKALKKLREYSFKKRPLSNATFTITFKQNERVSNAEELFSKIRAYIPNGLGDYAKEKVHIYKTAGYDNGFASIKLNIHASPESVVDMLLGKCDSLPATIIEAKDIRFDLPVPMTDIPQGKIQLKFSSSPREAHLRIESVDSGKEFVFAVQVLFVQIPAPCEELSTFRFYNDFFECKLRKHKRELSIYSLFGKTMPIKKWVEFLNFAEVVSKSAEFILSFLDPSKKSIMQIPFTLPSVIDWDCRAITKIARNVAYLFESFDINEPISIQFFEKEKMFLTLSSLILKKENFDFRLGFSTPLPELEKVCYSSISLSFSIGGKMYSIFAWGNIEIESDDKKTGLLIKRFDDYIQKCRDDNHEDFKNLIRENCERVMFKLQEKYPDKIIQPYHLELNPSLVLHFYCTADLIQSHDEDAVS